MMLTVRVECFLLDKHRLLSFVPLICGYAAVYVMSTKYRNCRQGTLLLSVEYQ